MSTGGSTKLGSSTGFQSQVRLNATNGFDVGVGTNEANVSGDIYDYVAFA
jgi:hypothetical protein